MLHSKVIKSIAAVMLVMGIFTACKKDAFSEKDAIAAQTTLLQTKFSYDLAIKQIDLQIQRSGDSAKIVIQNLVNSGATALEILKQTNMLAQILQNQNNALAQLRYADSLAKNTAVISDLLSRTRTLWQDSVDKAKSNAFIAANLQKNYALSFADNVTGQPLVGATVSVLPYGSASFATTTTNAQGVASFTGLVIDPGTFFSATLTGYSLALVRESSLAASTTTNGNITTTFKYNAATIQMFNLANTRNTIRGSVLGDVNLTNGDATEAIVGQLVTFTSTIILNGVTTVYQYSALSDANGNYSVSVPDATYTPVYPATIRVQQKLFVNAWQDQDQTTSLPRIDSTGTTLQSYGTVAAFPSSGSGQGYYYTFPSDTINPTKAVFAAVSSAGFNNNVFTPQNFTGQFQGVFTNRNQGTPKTDQLSDIRPFQNGNILFLNNLTTAQTTDNSIMYSQTANYSPAKPTAILPVTLVTLVNGWIITAPKLDAQVNGTTGKINSIQLNGTYTGAPSTGAAGVFNNAVMFTPSGRPAYQNQSGFGFFGGINNPIYLASLATQVRGANDVSAFAVNNGNSYYLPIEYKNTIARDRTPR